MKTKKEKQKGWSLIQLMSSMAIAASATVFLSSVVKTDSINRQADGAVHVLQAQADALELYVKEHRRDLMGTSGVINGVSDKWSPTLEELKKLGYLTRDGMGNIPGNININYALSTFPAGCIKDQGQCNTVIQVYPQHGFKDKKIAEATLEKLGDGGSISQLDSNGNWKLVQYGGRPGFGNSPVSEYNVPVITKIVMTSDDQFMLKSDGSRPLKQAWNVGGRSIVGASSWSTDRLVFSSLHNEGEPCGDPSGIWNASNVSRSNSTFFAVCPNFMLRCTNTGGSWTWQAALVNTTTVINKVVHQVHNCWNGQTLPASQTCPVKPPPPKPLCPDGSPMINGYCSGSAFQSQNINWLLASDRVLDAYYGVAPGTTYKFQTQTASSSWSFSGPVGTVIDFGVFVQTWCGTNCSVPYTGMLNIQFLKNGTSVQNVSFSDFSNWTINKTYYGQTQVNDPACPLVNQSGAFSNLKTVSFTWNFDGADIHILSLNSRCGY